MRRYYEGHEAVYQRLEAAGADCWGGADFEQVHMLGFLRDALVRTGLQERSQAEVLVLGCGTGPLACVLRRHGFRVSAVDISPTAIKLARQQAEKRGLTIHYRVGDVCRDPLGDRQYDLIVDSHCLHCIVPEADRRQALASIRRALRKDGFFVLETMMGQVRSDHVSTDEAGIVWNAHGDQEPDFEPRVLRDGQWFVPQRRLRPSKAALDDELRAAGFQITWCDTAASPQETGVSDYRAICQVAPGMDNHPNAG